MNNFRTYVGFTPSEMWTLIYIYICNIYYIYTKNRAQLLKAHKYVHVSYISIDSNNIQYMYYKRI